MCEFKKGDKVIYIKTDNYLELIKNKIYEVEKPNGDFVYLKGCKYGYFTFLFRKECEYCKNDGYYNRNKSLISKTLKNNVDIDLSINVKDKKIVASIENLKMSVEDNNWFLPTKKINYCPMCRTKTSRKLAEDGRKGGKVMTKEQEKDGNYWKGYVQKQKEAEEICKMCKYRKRYKELTKKESILDKVTDQLKKDISEAKEKIKYWEEQYRIAKSKEDEFYKNSYKRQINRWQSRFETLRGILNFIKGEENNGR